MGSFNLLGGYIEFEMDTTEAHPGVNTNLYTTSPQTCCDYCDIQDNGTPQCMEMDIIENNGNCLAQTTWHSRCRASALRFSLHSGSDGFQVRRTAQGVVT